MPMTISQLCCSLTMQELPCGKSGWHIVMVFLYEFKQYLWKCQQFTILHFKVKKKYFIFCHIVKLGFVIIFSKLVFNSHINKKSFVLKLTASFSNKIQNSTCYYWKKITYFKFESIMTEFTRSLFPICIFCLFTYFYIIPVIDYHLSST